MDGTVRFAFGVVDDEVGGRHGWMKVWRGDAFWRGRRVEVYRGACPNLEHLEYYILIGSVSMYDFPSLESYITPEFLFENIISPKASTGRTREGLRRCVFS